MILQNDNDNNNLILNIDHDILDNIHKNDISNQNQIENAINEIYNHENNGSISPNTSGSPNMIKQTRTE
jgi:hypothetical protein